jgi:hypothetical protein
MIILFPVRTIPTNPRELQLSNWCYNNKKLVIITVIIVITIISTIPFIVRVDMNTNVSFNY